MTDRLGTVRRKQNQGNKAHQIQADIRFPRPRQTDSKTRSLGLASFAPVKGKAWIRDSNGSEVSGFSRFSC